MTERLHNLVKATASIESNLGLGCKGEGAKKWRTAN